ncbi:MAG TPA: alpha-amylase family glycosyl hydrolase [Burkholderiaceae bacterium]
MKLLAPVLLSLFAVLPAFAQQTTTVVHPAWSENAAIYEANIRQYSPEGSFKEFEKHLPELKAMGVGVIWIMPINPIGQVNRKGTLGSYYAVRDYTAVNPELGTPEDFHHLVNAIHAQGMKVIIDWVANHTAWDHDWAKTHPDYYVHDDKGNFVPPVPDWHDVIKLDYRNLQLRAAMIAAMKYWVTDYDVDGFRCDVAAMVPVDFWNEARAELDQVKPVFMLAEAFEPALQEHAFDMTYGWQFKDLFNGIAQGKKTVADLDAYLNGEEKQYNPNSYRMLHITNHDLNSWEGTEFDRLGDATETFLVLSNVIKGMPLIYSGQEAGNHKALAFFERDPIEWKDHKFRGLYTKLFQLKKTNKALWNGLSGGELVRAHTTNDKAVFAFTRSKDGNEVIGIFNLSSKPQTVTIADKTMAGGFTDPISGTGVVLHSPLKLKLMPWEYRVYAK